MDVFVQQLVHDASESVRIFFVCDEQSQRQVSSLSPGSFAQQRMISLAHIGLETNGSTGSLEAKQFIRRAPTATVSARVSGAARLLSQHQGVKDEAGQHERQQSFSSRLESSLLQLHRSLSQNTQLRLTQRQLLQQSDQL